MRMPRPLVALAILADSAGALLMTRRTPASRRRPQLRARADDADEAEELRRIFESGADLLTPEEEMANEDAREGVASVFDAEDMRTLFHEGLAAEGDAPGTSAAQTCDLTIKAAACIDGDALAALPPGGSEYGEAAAGAVEDGSARS